MPLTTARLNCGLLAEHDATTDGSDSQSGLILRRSFDRCDAGNWIDFTSHPLAKRDEPCLFLTIYRCRDIRLTTIIMMCSNFKRSGCVCQACLRVGKASGQGLVRTSSTIKTIVHRILSMSAVRGRRVCVCVCACVAARVFFFSPIQGADQGA